MTEVGGSSAVPNGDSNNIYFHAPYDPKGRWHSLHDIAAKVINIPNDFDQYVISLCRTSQKNQRIISTW